MQIRDIEDVHVTSLEGLGASYRMSGYFNVKSSSGRPPIRVDFKGVAFGGNYGGHNVNIEIEEEAKNLLIKEKQYTFGDIELLISEVQRKMLNNEMIVEFDSIKQDEPTDGLGAI